MRPLGPVLAVLLGATLLAPVAATASSEEPDTTPPRVALDPCPETPVGEPCSQREAVWVVQHEVPESEGLAVAGVREGDTVLSEHVYDDGSGFVPYGVWIRPGNDVGQEADHATLTFIPPGLHELTFYARDLAGNEASFTRSVIGPEVPGRPFDLFLEQERRRTHVAWSVEQHGSFVLHHVVRVRGRAPIRIEPHGLGRTLSPERGEVSLALEPGRHVLRIFAVNFIGRGETRSVVVRVPRRGAPR